MKVDTHSLLLDAALFGSPASPCRGQRTQTEMLPPDASAVKWEDPGVVDAAEAPPLSPVD